MDDYSLSALDELEAEAIHILREAAAEAQRPAMLRSEEAGSQVLVRLARKAFAPGRVPFPLVDASEAAAGGFDALIGCGNPGEPRTEFWNLYESSAGSRVFPLAGWTELDFLRYMERETMPLAPHPGAERARGPHPGLLRFAIVGGASAGKSTLALRLLGAESERGAGRAWRDFSTPKRRFVLIDAAGGVQDTRAVGSAASHAGLALLVIDAVAGILAQTRRHAFICSLLGIPRLLVAVNRMDQAGWSRERFEALQADFEHFAARLGFRHLAFVPVSALGGDNVACASTCMPWYRGTPLLAQLEDSYTGGDRNLVDLRFAVQWVARDGSGPRYCGQVASGVLRAGDEVVVLPSHRRSRVRSIRLDERALPFACVPLSVAVELEDAPGAERGALLAPPANVPHAARGLEATVIWFGEAPLGPGKVYLLRHGASWVRASCAGVAYRINPDTQHREASGTLGANAFGRASFTLFEERFVDAYARNRATGCLVVADPETRRTLGAAMIIDREVERPRAGPREAAQVVPVQGKVSAAARARLLGQAPATVWLTGLSGAGKSTLAVELERRLAAAGRAGMLLDGDNLRTGLNRDLGFNPADRQENVRRVAEVARLLNDAGLIAIAAFISPYRADREMARGIIGAGRFVEVYVRAPLELCERRDPKGLYRKARSGEMREFTGVSAPYEAPEAPALTVDTASGSVAECVEALFAAVLARTAPHEE